MAPLAILLGLFMVSQPYTVSTHHLLCNEGKCPKINCFIGWQERNYDMNGRLFTTCRQHTFIGQVADDTHKHWYYSFKEYFGK